MVNVHSQTKIGLCKIFLFAVVAAAAVLDHLGHQQEQWCDQQLLDQHELVSGPRLQGRLETSQPDAADQVHFSSEKNDLLKIIDSSPLLSLHKRLVQFESVTGDEPDIAKWLQSFLEGHDFAVTLQDVGTRQDSEGGQGSLTRRARKNIYAVPDVTKYDQTSIHSLPKVVLTSHIDTVPPYIPYKLSVPSKGSKEFRREDIIISGRGTVDDKNCVSAQITAVMDLLKDPNINPSDLALLFVVGEETVGDGMHYFSNSELYHRNQGDLKAIIFGEPTENKLALGHKGIMQLKIEAHGKAAHSGYPWLGKSAVSMILPALSALDRLENVPEDQGGFKRSKEFSNTTVNIGVIQAGAASNVVPEYAFAKIAFRLAAGTFEENQKVAVDAIKAADPEGNLQLSFTQGYGPVHTDHDVSGFETIGVNYGTDVPNIDVARGVKRYLFGGGSILVAHGPNEHITVGELETSLEGYKKLVKHALET